MQRLGRDERPRRGRGSGGSGFMRSFIAPILVVAMIITIVLGLGYWGKSDPAATETKPAETNAPEAKQPAAPVQPAPEQKPAPAAQSPKPPDEKAIAEGRRHIDRSSGAKETSLVTVYYADGLKSSQWLQPVEVRIPATKGVIRATAEQVLHQPTDLYLFSNAPAGTKVQSANFDSKTGVATVDLSPEAAGIQGTAAVENLRASLVYSLTHINGVKAVQLWVNGRPPTLHGIVWDKPLSREDLALRGSYQVAQVIKFSP